MARKKRDLIFGAAIACGGVAFVGTFYSLAMLQAGTPVEEIVLTAIIALVAVLIGSVWGWLYYSKKGK